MKTPRFPPVYNTTIEFGCPSLHKTISRIPYFWGRHKRECLRGCPKLNFVEEPNCFTCSQFIKHVKDGKLDDNDFHWQYYDKQALDSLYKEGLKVKDMRVTALCECTRISDMESVTFIARTEDGQLYRFEQEK